MRKIFTLFLIASFIAQTGFSQQLDNQNNQADPNQNQNQPAFDPQAPVPIPAMRNVFFNTLWASVAAGMFKSALHMLDDSNSENVRYGTSEIAGQFFEGATIGGIAGFVIGLLLSFNNVTYYDNDILMRTGALAYYDNDTLAPPGLNISENLYQPTESITGNFNFSRRSDSQNPDFSSNSVNYHFPVLNYNF